MSPHRTLPTALATDYFTAGERNFEQKRNAEKLHGFRNSFQSSRNVIIEPYSKISDAL